jgi:two-component system sensor histidine kinase/response regulator
METTQGKKYKILVVDDNSENIRIIGSILRQNSYQVGFATRGQQALDILEAKSENYDLVLLDVNMPGLNGFEVCTTLRNNQRMKELPVIFLTANADPEHIIEGFNSGGQDYVTKPFHAGELLSRISTHIELKESREQLQQMNVILEEKVKERTKELEEANQKLAAVNRELEELDQAKADFLSIISHEINTPLNGIIGFAEILTEQLNDTEYFKFVEFLSESAHRLNDFAQSSLVITAIRTYPGKYKKQVLDLSKTIEEVLLTQHTFIAQKKIHPNFNCRSVNPVIVGNQDLIKTCLTHLFRNSIQYTPEGQLIDIAIYNEKGFLIVSIEDSGSGFTEAALQNVFKLFSPGDKHIDKNKGLGLFLVKMIIDFHQAKIDISNKSNYGARVLLTFNQVKYE